MNIRENPMYRNAKQVDHTSQRVKRIRALDPLELYKGFQAAATQAQNCKEALQQLADSLVNMRFSVAVVCDGVKQRRRIAGFNERGIPRPVLNAGEHFIADTDGTLVIIQSPAQG